MESKILVTGAAGAIGTNAIKRLIELKMPVRAMVHKVDERSDALDALGAEIKIGDMTDFNSVSENMKGITGVLFIYPVAEKLLQAAAYLSQAALEEKTGIIVNVSQRTSIRNAPSHSAQDHWLAERLFDRSEVPVAHLRPTLFMEWLIYFAMEIKNNNRYISPFGNARFGIIDCEDIGRTAAAILATPEGHGGKTYNLYGPSEITGQEVADKLSAILKREIAYNPFEPPAFGDMLRSYGLPEYQVKHIVAASQMFQTGEFRGMTDTVEEITGTKALSVENFIQKNIELFR